MKNERGSDFFLPSTKINGWKENCQLCSLYYKGLFAQALRVRGWGISAADTATAPKQEIS